MSMIGLESLTRNYAPGVGKNGFLVVLKIFDVNNGRYRKKFNEDHPIVVNMQAADDPEKIK